MGGSRVAERVLRHPSSSKRHSLQPLRTINGHVSTATNATHARGSVALPMRIDHV